mgnify:CR=1 FL=1
MPGSREEDFERNNAVSLHDLYDHALAQEPLQVNYLANFSFPHDHKLYAYYKKKIFNHRRNFVSQT